MKPRYAAALTLAGDGHEGVKEIERLIAKLQLDKEILAEPDNEDDAASKEVTK